MNFQVINTLSFALALISSLTLLGLLSEIQAQKKSNSKTLITIERHGCFGRCPVYSAKIYGDGTVIYKGISYVKVKGKRKYKISTDKVGQLVEEFRQVNYFLLKDKYTGNRYSGDATTTSISLDGKHKKIINDLGSVELSKLQNKIDEIVGLIKFVR